MRIRVIGACVVAMTFSMPASATDANAGKTLFRQQCSLCHSAEPNDNGGAQGPNLNGVFGRHAASSKGFAYTKALTNSGLTWDAATLDRFLSGPSKVVPGTAMMAEVPDKDQRENVIAYFQAVKTNTLAAPAAAAPQSIPPEMMASLLAGFGCHPSKEQIESGAKKLTNTYDMKTVLQSFGCKVPEVNDKDADWRNDKPGRVHRIDADKLVPPFATQAAVNQPQLIAKPADAKLSVPQGFHVDVFTTALEAPRTLRAAPNGDIFVAETAHGRVKVMRPSADGLKAETITTFAQGLVGPFGIQFYPSGDHPQWFYVAEINRVVRYAYKVGDMTATSVPEVVVPQLMPNSTAGHSTRDIAFSPDGKRMFISVGSASNVADNMSKKTVAEAQAWDSKQQALGAAWDADTDRADVLVFQVGSNQPRKIFATGIRNCVGLTIEPTTGDLWCTTNERDLLGDNLPPDYSTRVKEGGYYGWPWYYLGNHEDPRLKGARPDLAGKAIVPDVLYQAHSAPLNLMFYTATSGRSAFPKEYVGDGFAVLHGSWDTAHRTGHKVVRVRMKDGVPTGEYDDFLVGFIADDAHAWGRPVGIVAENDGSLLLSDDGNNMIYRISYGQ